MPNGTCRKRPDAQVIAQNGGGWAAFLSRRQLRGDAVVVALAVLGVRLAFMAHSGLTYEDALISLRYAVNWASGHGLVYNPGERVFGDTTPLYVLLLGLFCLLKAGSPLLWGKLMCAAAEALAGAAAATRVWPSR
jgi:hypothetical protein